MSMPPFQAASRASPHVPPSEWTSSFIQHHHPSQAAAAQQQTPLDYGSTYSPSPSAYYQPMYPNISAYPPLLQQQHQPYAKQKGKQKLVELDDQHWESQFAAFEQGGAGMHEDDMDAEAAEAIEKEMAGYDESFYGDFESIWNGINAERAENEMEDATADLDAFHDQFINGDQLLGPDGKPDLGEYTFEPDNPYLKHNDPFALGQSFLEKPGSGNLSQAALAFEAAVLQDHEKAQAWVLLGQTQAQNEKELAAIRALEQAIKVDPGNLAAFDELGSQLYERRIRYTSLF